MPAELDHAVKCRSNQNCTLDDIAKNLPDVRERKNIGKYSSYKSSNLKEKQPLRVEFKDKPREGWQKWLRRKILVKILVQQTIMPEIVQRQRRKCQRRNPPQGILNQTLWVMPSENNVMMAKTQEMNF
ncbi:hypothetical protein O181_104142 [Austropuccinia psidii MF-1]|uniref:Uncharacterized protein n=1 Tax=Austropuccinia psidii MF-1 TaxID=1389203 RepID=A0A9Q3PL52_9BASI|nr:hypothetical protein [Austropuccinia psidii MF-1]